MLTTTKMGPYPRLSSSQYCSGSHTAPRAMMMVVRLVYSARLSPFAFSSSRESPAQWRVHHQMQHFALQCCDLRSRDQSGSIQRYSRMSPSYYRQACGCYLYLNIREMICGRVRSHSEARQPIKDISWRVCLVTHSQECCPWHMQKSCRYNSITSHVWC